MANWAVTDYVIEGNKETLKKIYDAIEYTDKNEVGYKWEPDVLDTLGIDYKNMRNMYDNEIYIRGGIFPDTVKLSLDFTRLSFSAEEAYGLTDFSDVLKQVYQGLTVYYYVEESNEEVYATNDKDGKYFHERYYLDVCFNGNYETLYFDTEQQMYDWLAKETNNRVTNAEQVEEFNDEYESALDDENFIHIHEIEVVDN